MIHGKVFVRAAAAVVLVGCSGGSTGGGPKGSGEPPERAPSGSLMTALSAAGVDPNAPPSNRGTPAAMLAAALEAANAAANGKLSVHPESSPSLLSALAAAGIEPNARGGEGSANEPRTAAAEETAAARPLGEASDYVRAPGGRQFHKSCVYNLPDNARVDANQDVWLDGQKIDHIAPCPYSHVFSSSPWVTGGTQFANSFFTAMTAEFSVPPAPSTNNAQAPVGIWPGIETFANSSGDSYVMQPVLEYQQPEGSNQWTMQNMVVLGNNLIEEDSPIVVSPGQWINTIFEIDYVNSGSGCQPDGSNCQYAFGWQNASTNGPWHTLLTTVPLKWAWAQAAIFEAAQPSNYGGCNDFPAGSPTGSIFLGINFYEINPSQSGLNALFWPDAYNPTVNQPGFSGNFQFPTTGNGQTLRCGFQSSTFSSFYGAATNGFFIQWNSTLSPQGY
jgi:hypothetical protein